MQVSIINHSNNPLPQYQTEGSSGMDICAFMEHPITLQPMERKLVPTGLHIALPPGTEAQIRPRSGLAIKHGITCLNTPGTIDSDYRGEIKVILINLSTEPFTIHSGDRIAQMIICNYLKVSLNACSELPDTERASGGFGSTGV